MIALDTNLLVRYLTRDDADQAALVDDLLARCIEDGTTSPSPSWRSVSWGGC